MGKLLRRRIQKLIPLIEETEKVLVSNEIYFLQNFLIAVTADADVLAGIKPDPDRRNKANPERSAKETLHLFLE